MPFLRKRTASGVTDTLPGNAMNDREPAEQREAILRALRGDVDNTGLRPIMVRVEEDLGRLRPDGSRDGDSTGGYDDVATRKHLEGSRQGPR